MVKERLSKNIQNRRSVDLFIFHLYPSTFQLSAIRRFLCFTLFWRSTIYNQISRMKLLYIFIYFKQFMIPLSHGKKYGETKDVIYTQLWVTN